MSTDGAFSPLAIDAAARAASLADSQATTDQTGILIHTTTARRARIDDGFDYVRFTNAGAVTYTIPPNSEVSFPINTVIEFEQAGAGTVTVVGGAIPTGGNVTINSRGGSLALFGQYAVAALRKVGTDAWVLTGDL